MTALIDQSLKPLSQQIETLSERLIQEEAAAGVVCRTTEKGLPYELEVVERLRPWAQVVGATVEHVGGDNQAGDVLVRFSQASIAGLHISPRGHSAAGHNDDLISATWIVLTRVP